MVSPKRTRPSKQYGMRPPIPIALSLLLFGSLEVGFGGESDSSSIPRLGERIWSKPERRMVRATVYHSGKGAPDSNSKHKKSSDKVPLRYGSLKEVGTVAGPSWLAHGSLVKVPTRQGSYLFIAADYGASVDRQKASKVSGKTQGQRVAPVLDFCVKKQAWSDFVTVEIYYYEAKIPFEKLNRSDQKAVFDYARKFR